MEKIVKLSKRDWKTVDRLDNTYPKKLLRECFNVFVKKELKYNQQIGKTYLGREVIGEFSNKSDIERYDNKEEVIKWQFMSNIKNGCSRKMRGYSII